MSTSIRGFLPDERDRCGTRDVGPGRARRGGGIARKLRNPIGIIGADHYPHDGAFAIFAPLISPYSPSAQNGKRLLGPGRATDGHGRTGPGYLVAHHLRLARLVQVGIVAVLIALAIGLTIGVITGFYVGRIDTGLMRGWTSCSPSRG